MQAMRARLSTIPTLLTWLVAASFSLLPPASARSAVEVPVLAAIDANDRGVFKVLVMEWDRQGTPDPMVLKWGNNRVRVKGSALGALGQALAFAVDRSPGLRPTGTVSIYGAAYSPVSSDGPSAGAVMAVGFMALLRGDQLIRGTALTGTLQPDGRIGPVGAIGDKVRAAAREGYRTVLIPVGQRDDPRWNLNGLALDLHLTITEVATVDEAYRLMTGRQP
jgi:Lon-like protease